MNFEARYIDAGRRGRTDGNVDAIWCELNGRMRRFTADNVKETQAAGHRFYVRDGAHTSRDIHVVGALSHPHLHTDADCVQPNRLDDLPGRYGD